MKILKINTHENYNLFINVWDNVKKPIGCVLLIHDIFEDGKRYSAFAEFLQNNGFVVWINDLREHGKSRQENVEIPHNDYFKEIVNDHFLFTRMMDEKYDLPIIVIGNGFGAHVAERLIEVTNISKSVVLAGVSYNQSSFMITNRIYSTALLPFLNNEKSHSIYEKTFLNKLEKNFENKNWINNDDKQYEHFKSNFKNYSLPLNFYYSWFKNVAVKDKNIGNINTKTKILLLSGDNDIISGPKNLAKIKLKYDEYGIKSHITIFENVKHNIFDYNEDYINNKILDFLLKSVS